MLKKRLGVPQKKALRRGRVVRVMPMVKQATVDAWREDWRRNVAAQVGVVGLEAWELWMVGAVPGVFGQHY